MGVALQRRQYGATGTYGNQPHGSCILFTCTLQKWYYKHQWPLFAVFATLIIIIIIVVIWKQRNQEEEG